MAMRMSPGEGPPPHATQPQQQQQEEAEMQRGSVTMTTTVAAAAPGDDDDATIAMAGTAQTADPSPSPSAPSRPRPTPTMPAIALSDLLNPDDGIVGESEDPGLTEHSRDDGNDKAPREEPSAAVSLSGDSADAATMLMSLTGTVATPPSPSPTPPTKGSATAPVVTLATSRPRRSTAGTRRKSLYRQDDENEDDEDALAAGDDDEDYVDGGAGGPKPRVAANGNRMRPKRQTAQVKRSSTANKRQKLVSIDADKVTVALDGEDDEQMVILQAEPPTTTTRRGQSRGAPARPSASASVSASTSRGRTKSKRGRAGMIHPPETVDLATTGDDDPFEVVIAPPVQPTKSSKTSNKRKAPSRREPENEDDYLGHEVIVPPTIDLTQDPSLRCEYCLKSHSAYPTYRCDACRRVYHDKCFVHAFKSEIVVDEPIESQLERLQLHRPHGRASALRCSSCQAAFVDFHKNSGYHWDCACPTCTTAPEKIVDYRRVMLKRIIDNHNLDIKAKKQGGKGKAAGKQPSKPSGKQIKEAVTQVPKVLEQPSRSGLRRTRGSGGGPPLRNRHVLATSDPVVVDVSSPPSQTFSQAPPLSPMTTSNDNGVSKMHVEPIAVESQEEMPSFKMYNGSSRRESSKDVRTTAQPFASPDVTAIAVDTPSPNEHDDDDREKLNEGNMRRLTECKMEEDGVQFPVACTESPNMMASGVFKEGVAMWRPKRPLVINCNCCDHQRNKSYTPSEFVRHTNPSLPQQRSSVFLFVVRRDQKLERLDAVLPIVRRLFTMFGAPNKKTRRKKDLQSAQGSTCPPPVEEEIDAATMEKTIASFRKISLVPIAPGGELAASGQKHRPTAGGAHGPTPALFAAEVVCADSMAVRQFGEDIVDLVQRGFVKPVAYKLATVEIRSNLAMASTFTDVPVVCACCQASFSIPGLYEHAFGRSGDRNARQHVYVRTSNPSQAGEVVKLSVLMSACQTLRTQDRINEVLRYVVSTPSCKEEPAPVAAVGALPETKDEEGK